MTPATTRPATRAYSSPQRREQAEATRNRILEVFARQLGRLRPGQAPRALTRAGLVAGLSTEVRLTRLRRTRARIGELLESIGAPRADTDRAAAVVAVLESSEAGRPLVDVHGLSFEEAGNAAAEAIEAVVHRLRRLAAAPPVPASPGRNRRR